MITLQRAHQNWLRFWHAYMYRDMATMDAEGRVRLVGRLKEMINRGGENIYPKEIEELLHQHDLVQEAFVSVD